MSAVLFISSFLMYSRFLPFCPEPVTLAFFIPCPPFPGLCHVLAVVALPSLFALGDAFPAFKSQPKHCSLGEPFLTIPPSLLPTPAFQRAIIAPTAPPASCRISFTTAILPLPMTLFLSYLSYQTADCVREGNTSVFAHRCILQVSSRSLTEASACICGIDKTMNLWRVEWVDFHCHSPVNGCCLVPKSCLPLLWPQGL